MSNAPKPVSAEALQMLREITRPLRPRRFPSKSSARDELKRRGLVFSEPPNKNRAGIFALGKGHRWYPTPAGLAFIEYYGAEDNG